MKKINLQTLLTIRGGGNEKAMISGLVTGAAGGAALGTTICGPGCGVLFGLYGLGLGGGAGAM